MTYLITNLLKFLGWLGGPFVWLGRQLVWWFWVFLALVIVLGCIAWMVIFPKSRR